MSPLQAAIWYGLGSATELLDFLDVAYDALPDAIKAQVWRELSTSRPYGLKPQDKARAVYEHWQQIDVDKFIEGLILEQAQDAAIGKIGKKVGEASKLHNRPVGFQTGPAI